MPDIEWMNTKAQEAKERGDYTIFECWRRAYLNAQAAMRQEQALDTGGEVEYNEDS